MSVGKLGGGVVEAGHLDLNLVKLLLGGQVGGQQGLAVPFVLPDVLAPDRSIDVLELGSDVAGHHVVILLSLCLAEPRIAKPK